MSEEKVYVRFCESYRIAQASEPIEVDVESLRKCTPAYEGNTAEELLEYLEEIKDDYDWFEENKGNFDDEDDASLLIFDYTLLSFLYFPRSLMNIFFPFLYIPILKL